MNPEQCRAARALLDMSQQDLADAAGVGLSTVCDHENGRRRVSPKTCRRMQSALEKAGVEFISANGGGAGVRLKKARKR
jgi:DNA-binding XRE family transcriptional regulator